MHFFLGALRVKNKNKKGCVCDYLNTNQQGISYLSEVWARDLLNFGEKHFDHQSCENLMQFKRTGPPF